MNLRILEIRRWVLTLGRLPLLANGPVAASRLIVTLAMGYVEMRWPRFRGDRTRALVIGRGAHRRTVHLRANGMDTFTFYEVFIKGVYDAVLPLREDDVIMDLGANIGMASAYFDLRCPGISVLAVEPEEDNCRLWRLNVPSENARLVRAAVAPQDGRAMLSVNGPTSHRLVSDGASDTQCVPLETLGSLASRLQGAVTVVKCDIEGAEGAVFAKPSAIFSTARVIVMEIHGAALVQPIAENLRTFGLLASSVSTVEGLVAFTRSPAVVQHGAFAALTGQADDHLLHGPAHTEDTSDVGI